jgi:hypothetical protein
MDALGFEYPDYERLDKGAEGQKRKRVADVMNKDDEEQLKKKKLKPEPKADALKKRRMLRPHCRECRIGGRGSFLASQ